MKSELTATVPFSRRRFSHVFVLCTGRCGSVSFAKACGHFSNYTAGHETNRHPGSARFVYPEAHIEVDNRLAWLLGGLDERYGDDAFYVHLMRNEEQVAASYDRRWHHQTSLMRAFDRGISMHRESVPEAARDLVATVNANIRAFLRHKTHVVSGDIDDVTSWFPAFATAIGAEGDLVAAVAEFRVRHNATGPSDNPAATDARDADESHRVMQLTKLNKSLMAEKARLGTKLRASRRVNWMLAAPWLVLAAPVALPAAWLARGMRKRGKQRIDPARLLDQVTRRLMQSRRTLVYDAFLAHVAEGPARAAEILTRAGRACPPGARDLFRAMSARSDEEWLAATNAWGATASVPSISLRAGPEPRFKRLHFAPVEPVLSRDKVSVIMPAYNARHTIEQAAQSILQQSWRTLELIMVDDASSDGTAEVLGRIAAEDSRVVVLRNPVNVGPYVSKNRALLAATGRYVTGHDADDIALPTRIADQMQPIRDEAACVATIASMVRLDRDGAFSYPTKIGAYSHDGIARRAMISLLIERELLLDRLGFWDSVRFGADSEMLARATALLGPRLRDLSKVVMLCLNEEGSLTNHAEHGITLQEGVSPIRKEYCGAWAAWHAATPLEQRRLPFPHIERKFVAPEGMKVSADDLRKIMPADDSARRRAA